ncbi:MAG: phosphomannomutase/phosphoglucomutase [Candidatus Eisenbacteria bacterium]|nr:phosphomannomutase/phosphoglucomutase [Candidatus Eisenbacteria bacterium]
MNLHIFREYDIRGVADRDLDDGLVRQIGRAFGSRLVESGASVCLLGWDVRESSPRLKGSFGEGLAATGLEVRRIGLVPTPVLYYAIHKEGGGGGAMVTGSHNPPDQNGFKLCLGTAPLHGEGIRELAARIREGRFRSGGGAYRDLDLNGAYQEMVLSKCAPARPLSVVLDMGNGCAGLLAPRIFRSLGHRVVAIYEEPDGRFPNHQPDPTVPALMEDLCARVVSERADIGIGYDGDADRIGVVDDSGHLLYGDQLLSLFARDMLSRHPGEKVIFDVKCSQGLEEDIRAHGGVPIMAKTGHSLLKARMREENALLAGEMSGHIFLGEDFYGHDDAIYASARFASYLSRQDLPLSRLRESLPAYVNSPEIRVSCTDEAKFRVVEEVAGRLGATYPVVTIDGVRARIASGWGLLRASNTQPVLVLRFEARTPGDLGSIEAVFRGELSRFPEVRWDEAPIH